MYPDRDSPARRHTIPELLCSTWVSGPCSLMLSFPSFVLLLSPLSSVTLPSLHTPVSPCLATVLPPPQTPLHSLSAPSSSSSAKGGGASWPGGAQTYSPSSTCRHRSLAQPATTRLSSVSSHDSGFVSQDATYSKPPSPMPSDITSQVRDHQEDHVGGEWEPHADLTLSLGAGEQLAHRDWSHGLPAIPCFCHGSPTPRF